MIRFGLVQSIYGHISIFLGFNKMKRQFSWCKKAGFSFESFISTLLILPLIGIDSVYGLTFSKGTEWCQCGKDTYYRISANLNINWRAFLAQFVKLYLLKDELFTPPTNTTRCLVFDDTGLIKTGKTMEGISRIHNHLSKTY